MTSGDRDVLFAEMISQRGLQLLHLNDCLLRIAINLWS